MECAVCKQDVVDFKLVTLLPDGMKEQPPRPPGLPDLGQRQDSHDADNKSFFEESMFSPTARGPPGLDSAFKGFNLSDASIRVSTPPPANHATRGRTSSEYVVLRIDNVPWVWVSLADIYSADVSLGHHPSEYWCMVATTD